MGTGFFQSISGNQSSSRLIGFIVIMFALIFAQEVIWFGRQEIMTAAGAAGTIFLTIAAPAMAFLFAQKKTEIQHEKNTNMQETNSQQNDTDNSNS